ncbi:4'-phosphopantetheinyl transferase [Streptomyces canus]|uniref:4'-phosphopantetheinyl transferase family protein n=1 Tax=Streptomyces canus TaxID=58343 RepID=UPI0036C8647F
MISDVLPTGARGAESFGEQDEVALEALLPQESEAISHAGVRRRQEFAAVRHGARQALSALGLPPAALLPDQAGAPLWPDGVVGSMTHCTGYRASAVALRQDIASLGIDAEPNSPLPAGVGRLVLLPVEAERVRGLETAQPSVAWSRLFFCAKEAAYKAWYTLTGQPLDSADVEIVVNPEGTLAAAISLTPRGRAVPALRGRWSAQEGLLLVALAVPSPLSSEPQRHWDRP